jgi:hypothetical protein
METTETETMKKDRAAVSLGRRGGLVKSEAKAAAARLNGLKGGPSRWKKPLHLRKKRARKPHKPPTTFAKVKDL